MSAAAPLSLASNPAPTVPAAVSGHVAYNPINRSGITMLPPQPDFVRKATLDTVHQRGAVPQPPAECRRRLFAPAG